MGLIFPVNRVASELRAPFHFIQLGAEGEAGEKRLLRTYQLRLMHCLRHMY
jgi:hypothetical protein